MVPLQGTADQDGRGGRGDPRPPRRARLERRRANLAREVFAVASSRASRHLEQAVADDAELRRLLAEVQARELDPLTAVREILEKVFRIHDGDVDRTRTS